MLARKFRLGKKRLSQARSVKTPFFTLLVASNNLGYNRFSFVVSKEVESKAVGRNKIRRFFHSCIQEMLDSLTTGFDLVFIIKNPSASLSRQKIFTLLKDLLTKEKYIK